MGQLLCLMAENMRCKKKKKAYWDILLRHNITAWTSTFLLTHPLESLEPSSRVKRKSLRFGKQLQWAVIRLCHFSGSVDVLYPLLHKGLSVRITRKACMLQNASGCRRTSWYFFGNCIGHTVYWVIRHLLMAFYILHWISLLHFEFVAALMEREAYITEVFPFAKAWKVL